MCGLCGALSSELTNEHIEIFQGLMVCSTLRGPWGAGLAAVPTKVTKPVEIVRSPDITAAELAYSGDFYKIMKDKAKFTCMMGHARMPTSGGWGVEDCHPHTNGHIVGMHNGTMDFVSGQSVGKKDNDSSMLIAAIARDGLERTLQNSRGAYALTLINKTAATLTFVRNPQRTLFFASIENEGALFWASELNVLKLVLERRKYTSKDIQYRHLRPEVILKFRLHNAKTIHVLDHQNLAEHTVHNVSNDEHVRYRIFGAVTAARDELTNLLGEGCSNCRAQMLMSDYDKGEVHFFKPDEFMCHECLTHDSLARQYFTSFGVPLPRSITATTTH